MTTLRYYTVAYNIGYTYYTECLFDSAHNALEWALRMNLKKFVIDTYEVRV